MRVLHVIPSIAVASGGPGATLGNIIDIWQIQGINSDVLTIKRQDPCYSMETEVFQMAASFPARLSNSRAAISWFRRNAANYDVVMFHAIWSLINLRLAGVARRMNLRYVVIPHGSLDPFDLKKKALLKRILGPYIIKPYLSGARRIMSASSLESERLELYGAQSKCMFLPWPVKFAATSSNRTGKRAALGIPTDEFTILFFGRIDYKKGFPILLPAFARLLDSGVPARLLIVGPDSGGYRARVIKMITALNLTPHIQILEAVTGSAKSELLSVPDCFVLPSLNENFGVAIVEAMQHSIPVVISDNVYISEFVKQANAGLVCKYDINDLFLSLYRLAHDHAGRATMGAAAFALSGAFLPETLKQQYRDLLQEVLNEP